MHAGPERARVWGINTTLSILSKKRGKVDKGLSGSVLLLLSACMVMASSSWRQPQCDSSHPPSGKLLMSLTTNFLSFSSSNTRDVRRWVWPTKYQGWRTDVSTNKCVSRWRGNFVLGLSFSVINCISSHNLWFSHPVVILRQLWLIKNVLWHMIILLSKNSFFSVNEETASPTLFKGK